MIATKLKYKFGFREYVSLLKRANCILDFGVFFYIYIYLYFISFVTFYFLFLCRRVCSLQRETVWITTTITLLPHLTLYFICVHFRAKLFLRWNHIIPINLYSKVFQFKKVYCTWIHRLGFIWYLISKGKISKKTKAK